MNDRYAEIEYNGKTYKLVFSLDVMERLQEQFGSLTAWADRCHSAPEFDGEPDVRALKIGLMEMLNEGIAIENEDTGAHTPPLTERQVVRIVSAIGLTGALTRMDDLVVKSTDTGEKN